MKAIKQTHWRSRLFHRSDLDSYSNCRRPET